MATVKSGGLLRALRGLRGFCMSGGKLLSGTV
jgi:hypothetical protein